jgi:hypothetical protein
MTAHGNPAAGDGGGSVEADHPVGAIGAETIQSPIPNQGAATLADHAAPSWRDDLKVHPACDLFPPMSPEELLELGKDIKQHGLVNPIVYGVQDSADGAEYCLVDGRNRLDAMEAVGIPFRLLQLKNKMGWRELKLPKDFKFGNDTFGLPQPEMLQPEVDLFEYVISVNVHRRHLTAEQKRESIAKLIKAAPEKSNRQIADQVKVSHPYVAKVRTEMEKTGDVETVSTSIDTRGRRQPRSKPGARGPARTSSPRAITRSEAADPAAESALSRQERANLQMLVDRIARNIPRNRDIAELLDIVKLHLLAERGGGA